MKITEVPINSKFIEIFKSEGIDDLYPPQEQAVNAGVLDGRSIVLETPTASGKTLTAELAIAKALEEGKRAVYVVPLRALAYEKYLEFKKYESLGFRVHLEMGDLDSSKFYKVDFDILVATAEKCDSILRVRPDFFAGTGILVMDEIHMITTDRGPVYEILVSKFKKLFPGVQVIALSATIGNARELSDWLSAKLVNSVWRPVKLTETIATGDKPDEMQKAVKKSISGGGQVLIFVNSRRSTESVAEKLAPPVKTMIKSDKESLDNLNNISEEVLNALSTPTKQCERLSKCVKSGTSFHHAGITTKQRILIEDAFKKDLVKVIVATPTLAAGVNLPSRTVIIRDLMMYSKHGRMEYIPVLEYKQMIGRAGRPKYDSFGEAVIVAKNDDEKEFIIKNYINGKPEPIYSQLGLMPVLRFHVLAAVASDFARTRESLAGFFRSTFFGYQYALEKASAGFDYENEDDGDNDDDNYADSADFGGFRTASEYKSGNKSINKSMNKFENKIHKIIDELKDWKFIQEIKNVLLPTNIGKRISELYIDPQTARDYITIMQLAEENDHFPALGLLEMLCDAIEMPLLYINRNDEAVLWSQAAASEHELLRKIDSFGSDTTFLERFKTACVFNKWISEVSESDIMDEFNVAPGLLNQKIQVAIWLCYSASELSDIMSLNNTKREMKKLEIRIRHGIKEELIPLVNIKGIGRVRARKLFNAGFEAPKDLREADVEILGKLIGKKVAENVKEEIQK